DSRLTRGISGQFGTPDPAIEPLQLLHPAHVGARLGETDAGAAGEPPVDVVLARVVGGEGRPLVAVLVQQVAEVPRAVADVDLWVVEVGDREPRPTGVDGYPLGSRRQQLHEAYGPGLRLCVRAELRLGIDHRCEQRGVEAVVPRVAP